MDEGIHRQHQLSIPGRQCQARVLRPQALQLELELRFGGHILTEDCNAVSSHKETRLWLRIYPLRHVHQGQHHPLYQHLWRLRMEQELGYPPDRQSQTWDRAGGKLGTDGRQLLPHR